ncbi:MAG: GNAT family N-acetyltransferase [Flavobacteriales bacterium]|nr:GNAT family N-acetyltransferase [Flavobacteriales bacterium]
MVSLETKESTSLTFKRIGPDHFEDFQWLFQECFGVRIGIDKIRNKYDTEEFGMSYIGYFAFDGDKPAAHYAVLPVPMTIKGKDVIAVQSADTMTHSDYRGRGLFIKLAKMTYELAAKEGAKLVFGWPNKNSYPGFKNKLNWLELGLMKKYIFPVATLPLSEVFWKVKLLKSFYYQSILGAAKKRQGTFPSDIKVDVNGIPRSQSYLKYKANLGSVCLDIGRYGKAWVGFDTRMKVGDLSCEKKDLLQTIKHLKRLAGRWGFRQVVFIVSPGSAWDKQLSEYFKAVDDLPLMYYPFDKDYVLESLNLTGGDYDTF